MFGIYWTAIDAQSQPIAVGAISTVLLVALMASGCRDILLMFLWAALSVGLFVTGAYYIGSNLRMSDGIGLEGLAVTGWLILIMLRSTYISCRFSAGSNQA